MIGPSGRFELELAPGEYTLEVRDVLTRLVVGSGAKPVVVPAGETVNRNLLVKPLVLRIKLVPELGDDLPCLHRLQVEPDRVDGKRRRHDSFSHQIPGLALAPGQREVTVFVSPGEFTLSVTQFADYLRDTNRFRAQVGGTARAKVTKDSGEQIIKIKIAPAPTTKELSEPRK